jgi:hypothetical protein
VEKMNRTDAPTSFGIFSPRGYVVMAFATEADAKQAREALISHGLKGDSITFLGSRDMLDQIMKEEKEAEKIYQLGQEREKADRFAEFARSGSGFLAVYAPKDKDSRRDVEIVRQFKLEFAEKYNLLTLEELA